MRTTCIGALVLAALAGCQATSWPPTAHAPAASEACRAAPAGAACRHDLQLAAELEQRERAGQLLMLAAPAAPTEQIAAVARAALWLAPNAWLPAQARSRLDADDLELATAQGGASKNVSAEALLVLGGVDAQGIAGPAIALEVAVPDAGPVAEDFFALLLGAASSAAGVAYSARQGTVLVPAAPLLARILGAPLRLPPQSAAQARLVARADRALRAGRHAEARRLLSEALAGLGPSSLPCSARGALAYLRWTTTGISFASADSEALTSLQQSCTDAAVPVAEADMQRYLRELARLQQHLGTAPAELPDPWSTPDELAGWQRDVEALAARLPGPRAAILRALSADLGARASRPTGPCDLEHGKRVQAERKRQRLALGSAGRDDLALPTLETGGTGLTVTVGDTTALVAWLERPENRWVRSAALSSMLADPSLSLSGDAGFARLEPLCKLATTALLRDIRDDREEGFNERNVARWFGASRGAMSCRNVEASTTLVLELMDSAMKEAGGKMGVLRVLGFSALRGLEAAFNNRAHEALLALKALGDCATKIREQLGSSDEDLVLAAVLSVLEAAVVQCVNQLPNRLDHALEGAALQLEQVTRRPVGPTAPELVLAAPALHLAALAALAVSAAGRDDVRTRDQAMARLEEAFERDLATALRGFGVPEHADAAARVARAAVRLARALTAPEQADLTALLGAVEQADAPGAQEREYWAVGLDVARLALWDLTLHALAQAPVSRRPPTGAGPSHEEQALGRADRIALRLADGVVRDFGKDRPGFEILYLTPAVNRAVAAVATAPEGAEDLGFRALSAAEPGLSEGLEKLSRGLRGTKASDAGLLRVVADAFEAAEAEGGLRRLLLDPRAREPWARRLGDKAQSYPRELRVVVDVTRAVVEFDSNREAAETRLKQVAATAVGSQLRDVAYLPRLVEAVLLHQRGDTAGELQALDDVLAAGTEAESCGQPHEVRGLLPARAWALERLGRHPEADATLDGYLRKSANGGADGTLACYLSSYRPSFTFTATAKQRLGAMFFPTSQEGTFQVGMGTGDQRNVDRLTCGATPIFAPRLDLVLAAQLTRAAYALRAGDEGPAHASLLDAVGSARALVHGSVSSLGITDGAGIEEARKNASLPLLVWVATAARAHGQLAVARELEAAAKGIAAARSETVGAALETRPEVPGQLAELGLDPLLAPLARTWRQSTQAPSLRAEPVAAPSAAVPWGPWVTQLLNAQAELEQGRPAGAAAQLAKAQAPRDDAFAALTLARARRAARPQGAKPLSYLEAVAAIGLLSARALYAEAADVARDAARAAAAARKPEEARALLSKARELAQGEQAALIRAELLVAEEPLAADAAARARWAREMLAVEPALRGRISLEQELSLLQQVGVELGRHQDLAGLVLVVQRLRAIHEPTVGSSAPQALQLAAIELVLRSASAPVVEEELSSLMARAKAAGPEAAGTLRVLEALHRVRGLEAERQALARQLAAELFVP